MLIKTLKIWYRACYTLYKRRKIQKFNLEHNKNLSDLRFTVDQKNDMQLVEYVFKTLTIILNGKNWLSLKNKKCPL